MSRGVWLKLGVILLIVAGAGLVYLLLAPRVQPFPVYMALPRVSLTDQDGNVFDLSQTRGKVVVLSPIYTHCPDICPLITGKMRQIQTKIQSDGLGDRVRLVTFTVDPQRDSPEVLQRYARAYDAGPENWTFLSGSTDQIQVLISALGLYVERVYSIDNTLVPEKALTSPPADSFYLVNHTDRIFLVDRQGRVRALPPGSRAEVDEVVTQIEQLVRLPDEE
jgi:protein SCO1/2